MKHARADYNRIQDPANLIPEDEPVFLIRGQDICGPNTVRDYAMRARRFGASDELVQACLDQAELMAAWQATRKVKSPPDL